MASSSVCEGDADRGSHASLGFVDHSFLFDPERHLLILGGWIDAYWAMDDPFEHHRYVCLAILSTCREALEELDESEIRSMMLSLPKLDVRRLLAEAHSIKTSIQASQERAEHNRDLY
jgi:hypothetical protein